MLSTINKLIENLEKIKVNFKKNPSRKYSPENLLEKCEIIKEITKKYKECYKNLLDSKFDPKTLESLVKHKFYSLINELDAIIKEKIELLRKDKEYCENLASLDSLDYFDEFKNNFQEDKNIKEQSDSSPFVKNSEDTSKIINMSVAIDRFKALKLVPQLDSEGKNLSQFLSIVRELESLSENAEEIKKFIKFIIKAKCDEKTLRKLEICVNISNSTFLDKELKNIFKPTRTSLQIQSDLSSEKQGSKKVSDFASKIEDLTSELSNIRLSTVTNEEFKTLVRKEVDETGLNAFRLGLSEPFKTVIYASNPDTLTKAIQVAKDYESSIPQRNESTANVFKMNANNQTFQNKTYNNRNNYRNNNYNSRQYNNNNNNTNNRQNFNSQRNNFNNSPRNNYNNRFNNNFSYNRNNQQSNYQRYNNQNRSYSNNNNYNNRNARINHLNYTENFQDPEVQYASGGQ